MVTVPVLSTAMTPTDLARSSTSGPAMMTPSVAPRPVPTSRAVGVARPSAQGQAMMRTATAAVAANSRGSPASCQPANVIKAMMSTIGTNTPEIVSASACTGALRVWASSTMRAMRDSSVSSPSAVARTTRRPLAFRVAPITGSPGSLSTGSDSPVTIDSSTAEPPETTTPSVAIFSPGRTTNSSPSLRKSIGTRSSTPPRRIVASEAPSVSRARSAAELWVRARASNQRPASRKVMMATTASK